MINAFVNNSITVAANAIVPFSGSRAATRSSCTCNGGWLYYAPGSGQLQLTKPGRYKVDFSALVAASAAGNVTMTLTSNGEALAGTGMGATLAAADDTANLSTNAIVEVPCGASVTLAVLNTSATSITVDDASISITREC